MDWRFTVLSFSAEFCRLSMKQGSQIRNPACVKDGSPAASNRNIQAPPILHEANLPSGISSHGSENDDVSFIALESINSFHLDVQSSVEVTQ